MAGLKQTTAALAEQKRRFEEFLAAAKATGGLHDAAGAATPLREVADFGPNPGELKMLAYVPQGLAAGAPLVVALHGCSQSAAGFDRGTGWSALADSHGFALLLPEQQTSNNGNGCFNWFQPGDTRRDRGEARSIRAMIARIVRDEALDERRIFVTGLSAGGAMTSVMLATYPEVFAGGAIIAGMPYGAAANVQQALECMHNPASRPAPEWGYFVRRASRHKGPWPKISVWHGSADQNVQPANAGEIIKQWTDLHGLPLYPSEAELADTYERRIWRSPEGEAVIESFSVTGMAHGVPIAPGQCGAAGPFIIDAGVSSSHLIADFWGLTKAVDGQLSNVPVERPAVPGPVPARDLVANAGSRPQPRGLAAAGPGAVIEQALRTAGLLKP
jgi:feruloyl esterase